MTDIDLGSGHTVARHRVPKNMLRTVDEASAALSAAKASIMSWTKRQIAMQAPADFSGLVTCSSIGQSGLNYNVGVGGAIFVDERDVPIFTKFGFAPVPTVMPTTGLRVGLVFFDSAANGYFRFDSDAWTPVTLS